MFEHAVYIGMGIPYQLLLIPLYRTMIKTGLNDSLLALVWYILH